MLIGMVGIGDFNECGDQNATETCATAALLYTSSGVYLKIPMQCNMYASMHGSILGCKDETVQSALHYHHHTAAVSCVGAEGLHVHDVDGRFHADFPLPSIGIQSRA